jgi:hypothetical protein
MAEQSRAATANLAEQSDELARAVAQFRLETGAGEAAARSDARRSTSPAVRQNVARPALKTMANRRDGSAVRKPEADNWEDF